MADVQYPEDPQVEAEPNAQPVPAPDVAAAVPAVRNELPAQPDGELEVILHILLTFSTLFMHRLCLCITSICRIVVYLCYSLLGLSSDTGRVIVRLTDFSYSVPLLYTAK